MEQALQTLNPVIAALRPYVLPVTTSLPAPVHETLQSLVGRECHAALFLKLEPTPACASLALSKAIGFGIVGASAVVKLPQLLKLLSSRSARGISFVGYALETASFAIGLAYNARGGNPFSTYGESALIAAQNVVIAALVLHFSGRSAGAGAFVAAVAAGAYALASPDVVPRDLLGTLMAGAGGLAVASKVPQIYTVWKQGGTGQLSAFAVFNYLLGSLSRIFTTLQEVDDKIVLYGFVAGFILNAVLALQMVYYWNSPTTAPHAKEVGKTPEKIAMGGYGGSTATSTGAQKSVKSPTTRRRG